jgi:hypothetical protein
MNMKNNRRDFIKKLGVSIPMTTITSGCLNDTNSEENEDTNTISRTDKNMLEIDEIEFKAEIESKMTSSNPALIQLSILNNSDRTIELEPDSGGGKPLEYWRPVGDIIFIPTDPEHVIVNDDIDQPTDGCWISPDSSDIIYEDMSETVALDSGSDYSISHGIYYSGDNDFCFPDNEYRKGKNLKIVSNDTSDTISVELLLQIQNQSFSVSETTLE